MLTRGPSDGALRYLCHVHSQALWGCGPFWEGRDNHEGSEANRGLGVSPCLLARPLRRHAAGGTKWFKRIAADQVHDHDVMREVSLRNF